MKIMVVTPYFSPNIGGLENYALNIAKGLRDQGKHDVFIVTSNHNSKKYIDEKIEGLRVIRLPRLFKLSNTPINPFWYFKLRKIIKEEQPDVINAHSPVPLLADMAFFAREKIPFVFTYHAGSLKKGKFFIDLPIRIYENTVLKHILITSDEVISVYPKFIEKLIGNSKPIHQIQPGVDSSLFNINPKIIRDNMTVLYVGRIDRSSHWKGIEVLIRAIAQVKNSYPDINLQLVGDGDAVDDYRKLVNKLSLTNNVTFMGALRGDNLANAYQSATMLVLPSTTDAESFGMVLIEAMACGLPVIGSKIGGIPNVIKDHETGLLVKPNSIINLAISICSLLEFPETTKKYANKALVYISKDCNWQNKVKLTDLVFAEAIKPRVSITSNNVVHISAYYPPHLGGMESVIENLASWQHKHGINVEIVTSKIGYINHNDTYNGPLVKRLSAIEISNLPIIWNLLPALLMTPKKSIFHVHVAQAFLPEIAYIASIMKRVPIIAHFHLDVVPSSKFGFIFDLYKRIIFPIMLRIVDMVIVPTEDYKDLAINKYSVASSRIRVVPNGTYHIISKCAKSGIKLEHKLRLLCVCRLSPQKDIPLLLITIRSYIDVYGANVILTVVGNGSEETSIKKLIVSLGLENNVILKGSLYGNDLQKEYSDADIFILTSHSESFGLVFIEAMTKGLPIVSVNIPAIRNVVINNKNGLLSLSNPKNLAEALHRLVIDKTLYESISKNNIQKVDDYTWDKVAAKFNEVYREVL